jgi:hypothetical protein
MSYVDTMVDGYVAALLWAGLDWSLVTEDGKGEDNPIPLDENYDSDDISDEAMDTIRQECEEFYETHALILDWITTRGPEGCRFYGPEQAGIDFYLTRNGHGAGFWDRGLGILGDILSAGSKPYGETNEYPHEGKIYL